MTAQVHEDLILNSKHTSMACEPSIPHQDKRIITCDDDFFDNTACARGYVGTWEILNGLFYLIKLEGLYKLTESPILADWFSGKLRVPEGDIVNYAHAGFFSTYEKERLIEIKSGKVISELIVDGREVYDYL